MDGVHQLQLGRGKNQIHIMYMRHESITYWMYVIALHIVIQQ